MTRKLADPDLPCETGETVPAPHPTVREDYYAVGPAPLDLSDLCARVAESSAGAIATFSGTVRDTFEGQPVLYLEYEAYEPMALNILREIGGGLRTRWPLARIAIAHRTGRVEVGETSVIVAVSAAHRQPALEACAVAIESVKAKLPVWKKEFFEGGEVWRENDERSGLKPDPA